jgi:hypothetical protein
MSSCTVVIRMKANPRICKKHVSYHRGSPKPTGPEGENKVARVLRKGVSVLAVASSLLASASPHDAHAAARKISAADAAVTRKCSVLGFRIHKEYNSSTWPWYTYSTCMTEYGLKP